ncbi:hypothetical protein CJP74_02245 [Psittacicella melopsittaci]|uniref:UvrABC system protein A n=1 Tax=Psittacicella melopsittaci TaxID=2028576 RepID=A0A3A1Y7S8_9GAMM|nr:hypothetical protein [Psittacicella melopsittaci]RIY33268.1 hypothetical protein CJP74_02245 [Psittacicella melopsittaci]
MSFPRNIDIQNAYIHNLNIKHLEIPLNKFVVITGASGSGKSTLIHNVLTNQAARMLNLGLNRSLFNNLQYFSDHQALKVTGITPVQYLSQRFEHKSRRLNLAQFIDVETPINVLFSRFSAFADDNISEAYDKGKIYKLITNLPSPDKQTLENALQRRGQGYKYRYQVTFPIHLPMLPGLEDLDFPAPDNLTQDQIIARNKLIFKAINSNFNYDQDTVVVNKKHVFDYYDLQDDIEDLTFCIETFDVCFSEFRDPQNLPENFAINFDHAYDNALQYEEQAFKDYFNKHAAQQTDLHKLGLKNLKDEQRVEYTATNSNKLRILYPPSVGIYLPTQELLTDYPLQSVVENKQKKLVFDAHDLNAFSTFGKNKCPTCKGSGLNSASNDALNEYCPKCKGIGLAKYILAAKLENKTYKELFTEPLDKVYSFFQRYLKKEKGKISPSEKISNAVDMQVFKVSLIQEILTNLEHLIDLKLGYLNLVRKIYTLSGGEIQHIQLSKILTHQTTGVTYILDEPSIGLPPASNQVLINKLRAVVDRGNSVIVVEHDRDFITQADYVIVLHAGNITFAGEQQQLLEADIPLVKYLQYQTPISQVFADINNKNYNQALEQDKLSLDQEGLKNILINTNFSQNIANNLDTAKVYAKSLDISLETLFSPAYKEIKREKFVYVGVNQGYFKNQTVAFMRNAINVITGVSGSGKSFFAYRVLYLATQAALKPGVKVEEFKKQYKIKNILGGIGSSLTPEQKVNPGHKFSRIIYTKQNLHEVNLSRSISSYFNIDTDLAKIFADSAKLTFRQQNSVLGKSIILEEADFVIKTGKRKNLCSECNGKKYIQVQLEKDISENITCPECNGAGFAPYVLSVYLSYDPHSQMRYNIADFYKLTIDQAYEFLLKYHKSFPSIGLKHIILRLAYLKRFRLGHLSLGQKLEDISGGELQRLYLIREISGTKINKTNPKDQEYLIIIDEPTTGLHFDDIQSLLDFLVELRNEGHTIVLIEHNVDLVANCDYLVEFGPGAADNGGKVVFSGTINQLVQLVENPGNEYVSDMMQEIYNYNLKLHKFIAKEQEK